MRHGLRGANRSKQGRFRRFRTALEHRFRRHRWQWTHLSLDVAEAGAHEPRTDLAAGEDEHGEHGEERDVAWSEHGGILSLAMGGGDSNRAGCRGALWGGGARYVEMSEYGQTVPSAGRSQLPAVQSKLWGQLGFWTQPQPHSLLNRAASP